MKHVRPGTLFTHKGISGLFSFEMPSTEDGLAHFLNHNDEEIYLFAWSRMEVFQRRQIVRDTYSPKHAKYGSTDTVYGS